MKKWIIALMIAVLPGVALAGGTLEDVTFYSESLGEEMDFRVYLPEGYDPDRGPKYPVVYFLHGTDYSYPIYWFFFGMQTILDDLIESHLLPNEVHDALVDVIHLPRLGIHELPHLGKLQDQETGDGQGFHLFGFPHFVDTALQEVFQGDIQQRKKQDDDAGAQNEGGATEQQEP